MLFSIFDVLRFFEALQMLFFKLLLTLSWRRLSSYRNQWFLYDNGLGHERVKMGKKWRKILSLTYSLKFKNIILFLNRYLYIFFQMVIFATLFQRCPTLWKSALKNIMLIWRCATPWRHITLKAMLNRRLNVCWVVKGGWALKAA